MRTAVIVDPIAVTTEYWEESQADGTRETGCRVQLRRVRTVPAPVPPPQPRRDAVFWSIEEPVWRADLFSVVGGAAAFDAAHYHPTFSGLVPCERVGDPTIEADPFGWIERRLADVPGDARGGGAPGAGRRSRRGRASPGDAGDPGHDPGDARLSTPRTRRHDAAVRCRRAGSASASSASSTTTSPAGSRRSRAFPTSSRSSRCTTRIPSWLARWPRRTTTRRSVPAWARRTAASRSRRRLDDLIERHALDVALVTLPERRRAGGDRAPGRGRDPHDHRQARGSNRARGATGVRCRPGRRGPRGRRPDAALLARGPDGARAGRGRPARAPHRGGGDLRHVVRAGARPAQPAVRSASGAAAGSSAGSASTTSTPSSG